MLLTTKVHTNRNWRKWRLRATLTCLLLVAASLAIDIAKPQTSLADHQTPTDSTWMPFIGEYKVWCTLAIGTGPCATHHGTWGIDFDTPINVPIYATGSGHLKQLYGGCSMYGGSCNSGAGNWLSIDHGDHWSRYIHLSSFAAGIAVGDWIEAGQLVGYAGLSGTTSTASHLHYDETSPQNLPVNRIFFGPFVACHGNTMVQYPDVLGTSDWQQVPYGTVIRNDGYECLGGSGSSPTQPTDDNEINQDTDGFFPSSWIGAEGQDLFGSSSISADFDGDGEADLAVGSPGEGVGSRSEAGLVNVIYGLPRLNVNTGIYQGNDSWPGYAEAGDEFGAALAAGDFDNDGFDDLVVGVPGESIGSRNNAGLVMVTYGSSNGLENPENIYQNTPGVKGGSEPGDLFGSSLATGDINGDGYDDLVVGVPGEGIGSRDDAGAINILYGSASGITADNDQFFSQNSPGIRGGSEPGDLFGYAVDVFDIDADGYDDVIIGVPGEGIGSRNNAGLVHILYGSASGASGDNDGLFHQNSSGWPGASETGDRFGYAVDAADIDGDGIGDLIIGIPDEDIGSISNSGLIQIRFNPDEHSDTTPSVQSLHQGSTGVEGNLEAGDRFGAFVLAADVTGDGTDDVIVGIPNESIGSDNNAGAVSLFPTTAGILDVDTDELFHADLTTFEGTAQTNALFGSSIITIDEDIIIGAPGQNVNGNTNAGSIYYLNR